MTKNRFEELQVMIEHEKPGKKNKHKIVKSRLGDAELTPFESFEVIQRWIDTLQENSNKCQEAYRKAPNSKGLSKKLEKIFKHSETLAYDTAQTLKKISASLHQSENKTCAEYRMQLVQYAGLVERFKRVAAAHEKWTEQICSAEKSFIQRCHQIVNHDDLDDAQLTQLIDENPQIFTQDYIQNELEARRQLADLEARHEQLVTIEAHLGEIRNLFVQLATLVELQQESLDRVEYFTTGATDVVQDAAEELNKAKKKKKMGRIMKICILIGVIVVVLIVLGFVLPH